MDRQGRLRLRVCHRPRSGVLMRRPRRLAAMVILAAALVLTAGVRPAQAAPVGDFSIRLLETSDIAIGRTPVEPLFLVHRYGPATTGVVLTVDLKDVAGNVTVQPAAPGCTIDVPARVIRCELGDIA